MNSPMIVRSVLVAILLALVVGCASPRPEENVATPVPVSNSFQAKGQAGLNRLEQNNMQAVCSEFEGQAVPPELAKRIIDEASAGVRFPTDGQYLGDWRNGEAIARSGAGMQLNDDPAKPNGGNCYACHQLAAAEISYGTLGPSLTQYGKLRGTSEPILQYAWTRLWNAHAYNACSHMPRFGDAGILTEQQLKDVMAFLFDPESPVNRKAD